MGDTPKWMKRLVRARMKETGEKYTKTLRDIKAEYEVAKLGIRHDDSDESKAEITTKVGVILKELRKDDGGG